MKIREAQNLSNEVVDVIFQSNSQRGVTNYDISKRTNISQTALSYIKNHKRQPTLYILLMIAEASDIKLSQIISSIVEKNKSL